MEPIIRTIGLAITLLVAVYAFKKRGDMLALAFVVLSPLSYFSQSVGIVLSPAKFLGLIFLGFIFLRPSMTNVRVNKYFNYFKYYYIYIIYITMVMTFLWPEASVSEQNFMYGNSMRGIVQIFQVFMGLAIVVVMMNGLTSIRSMFRVQVAMLFSMVFLAIYGLYVWFAQRTGLPFNPITRSGGVYSELNKVISTTIDGVSNARAYSLSGEPKSLAVNACFGVILTFFTTSNQVRYLNGTKGELLLLSLFLITLYLTLSTAGFIILPLIVFVAIAIQIRVGQFNINMMVRLFAFIIFMIAASFFGNVDIIERIGSIYELRVETRLNDDGMFTYADAAMIKFWSDSPLHTISGVGLGGSSFYVREYDTYSYAGFTAAPRGMVGFVGDKGFIGLFLFGLAIYKSSKPIIFAARSKSPNRKIYAGILTICLVNVVMLFTYALWAVEWITVGLLCAGATLADREMRMRRSAASH